jgi:hypothetical protein
MEATTDLIQRKRRAGNALPDPCFDKINLLYLIARTSCASCSRLGLRLAGFKAEMFARLHNHPSNKSRVSTGRFARPIKGFQI